MTYLKVFTERFTLCRLVLSRSESLLQDNLRRGAQWMPSNCDSSFRQNLLIFLSRSWKSFTCSILDKEDVSTTRQTCIQARNREETHVPKLFFRVKIRTIELKRDPGILLFSFTSLSNLSGKPSKFSQPIKIEIETNRDLVSWSFQR